MIIFYGNEFDLLTKQKFLVLTWGGSEVNLFVFLYRTYFFGNEFSKNYFNYIMISSTKYTWYLIE